MFKLGTTIFLARYGIRTVTDIDQVSVHGQLFTLYTLTQQNGTTERFNTNALSVHRARLPVSKEKIIEVLATLSKRATVSTRHSDERSKIIATLLNEGTPADNARVLRLLHSLNTAKWAPTRTAQYDCALKCLAAEIAFVQNRTMADITKVIIQQMNDSHFALA
jgi:RNA polymerase-interacting CarD/CdnL/TRCF family regulator